MAEVTKGPAASPGQHLEHPTAAALACVPGLESGRRPLRVTSLEGGTVNQLWHVESTAGSFVLRIDGAQARRPGVDRGREFLLHGRAAAAQLAPQIVAGNPASGVMVSQFIAGRRWEASGFGNQQALCRLGERLACLHQITAPLAPFEPLEIGQAYAASAPETMRSYARTVARLLEAIAAAQERFAADAAGRVIIHGDLNHLNLIENDRLWLVDWEYAQVADPLFDLGCLMAYYPEAEQHASDLLAAAGLAGGEQRSRLSVATFIYQALSWLWHIARGEPPPGEAPQLA